MSEAVRPGVAVFVGTWLPFSETFIYDQVRSHIRYRPSVYAYQRGQAAERFPFSPVCALSGAARLRYLTLGQAPAFDEALRAHRATLIHAHFGTNGVYALPFARRHGLPLVVTFHGHDVPSLLGRARFTARYARYAALAPRMLKAAALLLPASRDLADRLIGEIGADPRKVEVLRLGVDLERFRPGEGRDAVPTVVMVGRFVEKKGHVYGLRAFAQALREVPGARLVLIGSGELQSAYAAEIDALGLRGAVELAGVLPHEEVVAQMARARVVLCPSVTARSGDVESGVIVLKEAGAVATASIGTVHGGIPEILVDGETGFLVPERDVARTAECLVQLLRDERLAEQMGRAARAHIEAEYDLRQQVARLESLYDRALGRSG